MKYLPQSKLKQYREENKPCVCPILGCSMDDAVVDHSHPSNRGNGQIRGVLSRTGNSLLGKAENFFYRFCAKSTDLTLPQVLRRAAEYLERRETGLLHPVGLKQLVRKFQQLPADKQREILRGMGESSKDVLTSPKRRAQSYRELLKAGR